MSTIPAISDKDCTRCKRTLALELFGWLTRHRNGKDQRYRDSWCGDCRVEYKRLASQRLKANAARQRRLERDAEARARKRAQDKAHYAKVRAVKWATADAHTRRAGWLNRRLQQKYGLSVHEYLALCEQQQNCCAICGRPARDRSKRLAVDHDHGTQTIRGLLCHHCNTGLGNFNDDPALLRAAIAYLAKFQKVPA